VCVRTANLHSVPQGRLAFRLVQTRLEGKGIAAGKSAPPLKHSREVASNETLQVVERWPLKFDFGYA
jgi:hypothetical protein